MLVLTADEPIIISPPGQRPITIRASYEHGRVKITFEALPDVIIDRESVYMAKAADRRKGVSRDTN